jgi:hypothetical protein
MIVAAGKSELLTELIVCLNGTAEEAHSFVAAVALWKR